MRNKILFIAIGLMVINYYVEKWIFYSKNTYYTKNVRENSPEDGVNQTKKARELTVLENNFETLVVNRGRNHGIKVNQVVIGPNGGFVGIVEKVENNIAIVQTFWSKKSNIIVVNGENSYGYIRSNGYHLIIENKQKHNDFRQNDDLYISFSHSPTGLVKFGKLVKYKLHMEPCPIENIIKIKTLYIID